MIGVWQGVRDLGGVKLDRIADVLGIPMSDVRSWIHELCGEPAVTVQMSPADEEGPLDVQRSGETHLPFDEVVRAVEAVVVEEAGLSLSEIQERTGLSALDSQTVCAKALALKFDLDPLIVARSLQAVEFSSDCLFVGASQRDSEGHLVFGSGVEKRHAKALFKAFASAAEDLRQKLKPFIDDPDPDTGLPALDLLMSSSPWLREVPREVYEPLLKWAAEGGLAQLLCDVEEAKTGTRDEHRKNVAVLVHAVFEAAGHERATRHDGEPTLFMEFAETMGRLYDLKINHGLLEATTAQQSLFGVPSFRVVDRKS